MAVAGAGAKIMVKVGAGAGAENKYFGSATLIYNMERPRGVNCVKAGGGRTLCT